MADKERQIEILRQGPDAWNQWRRDNPTIDVDLVGADLSGAHLSGVDLDGAERAGADLSGAYLMRANLTRAHLMRANLSGAYLTRADLSGADLRGADLSGADLRKADLRKAVLGSDLRTVYVEASDLRASDPSMDLEGAPIAVPFPVPGADLHGANLREANLREADLSEVDLSGADLSEVDLSGANLTRATLNDARLTDATGIRFDDNPIRGTHFTARYRSYNDDPWSLLRRRYTGANLVLAWLALFAFLLPRMLTTIGLFLLGEYQEVASDVVGLLADPTQVPDPRVADAVARYADEGRSYAMWQVVLGIHRGGWSAYVWAALIVVLFGYNFGRFFLTLRVAALRDNEARSAVTPSRDDYEPLYRRHQVLAPIRLVAICFALVNFGRFVVWVRTERITLFGD